MPRRELNRHRFAPLLVGIYRLAGGARRRRVAHAVFAALGRLEGHGQRSATTRVLLARDHGVRVGAFSYGECFVPGAFAAGCTVGRYVSVGPGVRAFTRNHPLDRVSTAPFFYEGPNQIPHGDATHRLVIGHDVWLGARCTLTPGCSRIGTGAVVGAGAVVTRDVPPYAVVAGVPARVLRYRFDEPTRAALLASRWWKHPPETLQQEPGLMTDPADAAAADRLARLTAADPEAAPTTPTRASAPSASDPARPLPA